MSRNQRRRLAGGLSCKVVVAPARKQIGIVSIGQRDTGDRHIGTKHLFDHLPFGKASGASSRASFRWDCHDALLVLLRVRTRGIGNMEACRAER